MIIPCGKCGLLNRIKETEAGRPVCGKCHEPLPEMPAVLPVDGKSFEAITAAGEGPVLVDFWATWCGPCRMLAPILEKFSRLHPHIQVLKMDTDQNAEQAERFQISMVPTLILFERGQAAKRISGVFSLGDLEEHFRDWIPAAH